MVINGVFECENSWFAMWGRAKLWRDAMPMGATWQNCQVCVGATVHGTGAWAIQVHVGIRGRCNSMG